MTDNTWLAPLLQLLVLLPAAASCYFAVKDRRQYSFIRTAALCTAALLPCCFLGAWLCSSRGLSVNVAFFASLVLFFFLYRRTVDADLSRCLAVYVGVCAVQTFPAQFDHAFHAALYPSSAGTALPAEAALFQLGLSCLIVLLAVRPACFRFSHTVDCLDIPKIWYSTVVISSVFLLLNVLAVPQFYAALYPGRLLYLFVLLEGEALALLAAIYVLFYWGATVILEHAEGWRYFSLTAEVHRGSRLYIVSTNSFDGKVKRGKHGYLSTKHSGAGTGLASIAAVADKYGGSMRAQSSEKEFCVDAVLNI